MRSYELDGNGHVNNSVYLAYAEEIATLHAEALGFGRAWTLQQGGMWVVHKHEIVYRRAATYGDDLDLTTRVIELRGARAVRGTSIRLTDGQAVSDIRTEWVWVRAADGRPARLPESLVEAFGGPLAEAQQSAG